MLARLGHGPSQTLGDTAGICADADTARSPTVVLGGPGQRDSEAVQADRRDEAVLAMHLPLATCTRLSTSMPSPACRPPVQHPATPADGTASGASPHSSENSANSVLTSTLQPAAQNRSAFFLANAEALVTALTASPLHCRLLLVSFAAAPPRLPPGVTGASRARLSRLDSCSLGPDSKVEAWRVMTE